MDKKQQFVPESMPESNRKETRDGRMREIIRDLASRYIEQESNHISLITVTNVALENRGKQATVYITVLPNNKEKGVIDFLKRKRSEFRQFVTDKSRLSRIPFFDFEIDMGEKNRQRIDEIGRGV